MPLIGQEHRFPANLQTRDRSRDTLVVRAQYMKANLAALLRVHCQKFADANSIQIKVPALPVTVCLWLYRGAKLTSFPRRLTDCALLRGILHVTTASCEHHQYHSECVHNHTYTQTGLLGCVFVISHSGVLYRWRCLHWTLISLPQRSQSQLPAVAPDSLPQLAHIQEECVCVAFPMDKQTNKGLTDMLTF